MQNSLLEARFLEVLLLYVFAVVGMIAVFTWVSSKQATRRKEKAAKEGKYEKHRQGTWKSFHNTLFLS